jgi:hypothetical protein
VQRDAVVGEHGERLAPQPAELVGARRAGPPGADHAALDDHPGGDRGCGGTHPGGADPQPAIAHHVCDSPLDDTWRRVKRPPILVTIS